LKLNLFIMLITVWKGKIKNQILNKSNINIKCHLNKNLLETELVVG
jgi:hypothetical protein